MFDPFFTTKASGTGLGLSICYGIAERHRGEIEILSPARGGEAGGGRRPAPVGEAQAPRAPAGRGTIVRVRLRGGTR